MELKLDKRFNQHVIGPVMSEIGTAFHMLYVDAMGDRLTGPLAGEKVMSTITKEKADRLKETLSKFIDLQCDMYLEMFKEET